MDATLDDAVRRAVAEAVRTEVVAPLLAAIRAEIARIGRHDLDRLIGVEDAARLLSMSQAATRKAAARGTLPVRRIGRRLRFRVGDLLALGVIRGAK